MERFYALNSKFLFSTLVFLSLIFGGCTSSETNEQEDLEASDKEEAAESKEESASEAKADPSATQENKEDSMPVEHVGLLQQDKEKEQAVIPVEEKAAVGKNENSSASEKEVPLIEEHEDSFKYRIVRGDWLSKIAKKVYGDMKKWDLIYKANHGIKNPNLILAGGVLIIPLKNAKAKAFAKKYKFAKSDDLQEEIREETTVVPQRKKFSQKENFEKREFSKTHYRVDYSYMNFSTHEEWEASYSLQSKPKKIAQVSVDKTLKVNGQEKKIHRALFFRLVV